MLWSERNCTNRDILKIRTTPVGNGGTIFTYSDKTILLSECEPKLKYICTIFLGRIDRLWLLTFQQSFVWLFILTIVLLCWISGLIFGGTTVGKTWKTPVLPRIYRKESETFILSRVSNQINSIDVNFHLQKSLEIFDKNSALPHANLG